MDDGARGGSRIRAILKWESDPTLQLRGKVSASIELLRYFSISKIPPGPELFSKQGAQEGKVESASL